MHTSTSGMCRQKTSGNNRHAERHSRQNQVKNIAPSGKSRLISINPAAKKQAAKTTMLSGIPAKTSAKT
jgi:hypothetical protein